MAGISNEKNGTRVIQITVDGKRQKIRLGKVSRRVAESILVHVKALRDAKALRVEVPSSTVEWASQLDDVLYKRIAKVGLLDARVEKEEWPTTLSAFIDKYVEMFEPTVTEATVKTWLQAREMLMEHLDPLTSLRTVTEGDAVEYRNYLLKRKNKRTDADKLSESTIRKHCSICKQFFAHALKKRLILENPFDSKKVPTSAPKLKQKEHISAKDSERVISFLPTTELKLAFAFCRYAGTRVPSELRVLDWSHVFWDEDRIRIHGPKNKRWREFREVPIFPELKPYLLDAWEESSAKDSEKILPSIAFRGDSYMRKPVLAAIKKAGIEPWPSLFDTLRATRDTELREKFPTHVVDYWMDHEYRVARKHYSQVTDEHFERAAMTLKKPKAGQKAGQHSAESTSTNK